MNFPRGHGKSLLIDWAYFSKYSLNKLFKIDLKRVFIRSFFTILTL
jgi:hypothetical protein